MVAAQSEGSSPRMRGTRTISIRAFGKIGIIPAYAGNTVWAWPVRDSTRDHPRVCGEHHTSSWMLSCVVGSSPRMRGTLFGVLVFTTSRGIIPAYAGNTISVTFSRIDVRDHPRVCGEHLTTGISIPIFMGIIPAYAGNTLRPSGQQTDRRDHPRVCGEHTKRLA